MSHGNTHRRVRGVSTLDQYATVARYVAGVQTLVAAGKATFAMALLAVATPVAPAVVALLAFAVYNANNLADRDEDAVNVPAQAAFVSRHARAIGAVSALAAVLAVALAVVAGGLLAGAVALTPLAAGVVYSAPVVPGSGRRLKDVFVANTALVAAAWAATVAFLPATLADGVGLPAALAVFGFFFCRTFVSVEVFNARDVDGDRASGVATLPVCLGLSGTRRVLFAVDAVALALVAAGASASALSPTVALAAVPVTGLSVALTAAMSRITYWPLVCLAKDCEYLVLGAAGLVAL